MENKKELEADSQNVSEETEEKTEEDSQETSTEDQSSKKGDSTYTDREKQLYERAKKAEAKAKRAEKVEDKVKESNKDSNMPDTPVEEIAKTVHALKDYSSEEVETIFKQAKNMNVSPLEALKDEDVGLLIQAKRAKVEKESKTPEPTNRQGVDEKKYSEWTNEDINNSDLDSLSKYYDFIKKQR